MSTASSRLLIVLAIFATLAGCAADRPRSEPATGTLRTALPPAELPTYGIGDTYTFDEVKDRLERAGFAAVEQVRSGENMDAVVEARKPE